MSATTTLPLVDIVGTTGGGGVGDGGDGATDVTVIVTVAACIGGLFLVVLIIFIIFVIYFYRKQVKEDNNEKKPPLKTDRLDWKRHPLARQFGDIDDIDEMLWRDRGRTVDEQTDNPAFGKDFEPLDVNNLKAFDSADDEGASTRETESTSDLVEINMDDEDETDDPQPAGTERQSAKQISILDMKTWGQPGTSRQNSIRSVNKFGPPPSFAPRDPQTPDGRSSLRSQDGSPFPYAGTTSRHNSISSQGGFPFSVSQPSNDPRFEYTRTNPLMVEALSRSPTDRFPFSGGDARTDYTQSNFGGTDDIESVEFDRSSTLRGSRRNQSVVDFYESGTRTTGSSFSLALEGSGSIGRNLLWQNKKFGGLGFSGTK